MPAHVEMQGHCVVGCVVLHPLTPLTAEFYGLLPASVTRNTHVWLLAASANGLQPICAEAIVETPTLQYFETAQVAGIPGKSITVRLADGRVLGRFRGVIIDPLNEHLRYW